MFTTEQGQRMQSALMDNIAGNVQRKLSDVDKEWFKSYLKDRLIDHIIKFDSNFGYWKNNILDFLVNGRREDFFIALPSLLTEFIKNLLGLPIKPIF